MSLFRRAWRTFSGWPRWVQVLTGVVIVIVIAVVAGNSGSKKNRFGVGPITNELGAATSGPSASATTGSSASTTTKYAPLVTGFGATDAAWNSTHTEDHVFAPGAAYDADPSLPEVNGHVGTHYAAVQHENGHVLGYEYRFNNTPIATAKADVLQTQFPPDAKVAWFATKATCAQMMVTSATLAKALSSKAIGDRDGSAFVEFSSGPAENSYNPKAVNDAIFLLLPLGPKSKAPGC